jgi:hypothetical protein
LIAAHGPFPSTLCDIHFPIGKCPKSVNVSQGYAASASDLDCARLTALEARGTESCNDEYRGNDKVMRERQWVEILRRGLAEQGFPSTADVKAAIVVDFETRVTDAA